MNYVVKATISSVGVDFLGFMTTVTYRGVTYDREDHQKEHMDWWVYVHRAALWLCYRGIKYRPSVNYDGPSVF